jgi:hypothetical protein
VLIPQVCKALIFALKSEFLSIPSNENEWEGIAKSFNDIWNFPHCIGAVDGKRVAIIPPPNTGSLYYNYKHFFSVVLMAIVDADLKFICVDIGCNGRMSDAGIWQRTPLASAMNNKTARIPPPKCLPNSADIIAPFVFVTDEGFALRDYMLRPYSSRELDMHKRIFYYRLSRARRVSENAFGMLANRFQMFHFPIKLQHTKVRNVIMACCCLHNYLRSSATSRLIYSPMELVDAEDVATGDVRPGSWRRNSLGPFTPVSGGAATFSSNSAWKIRDSYCDYFNGVGSVSWQQASVFK